MHELPGPQLARLHHLQHGAEARRLHAARADDGRLLEHDQVDRQRHLALLRLRREADLEVAAALAERVDRVPAGGGDAERVDRHVRAPAREIEDGGRGIALGRVHGRDRAQLLREGELLVRDVDRDHVGAERGRDLHRREPHAAAAVHRDPLACSHLRLIHEAVERGHVAAAHARRLDEADRLGERDQVHVGEGHAGAPPVAAPRHHARREHRVADVVVAAPAPLAAALAHAERDEDAVALPPARDPGPDLVDHAAELVAEDVRQRELEADPAPVAHPQVPVGAADAVRLDADDDTLLGRRRVGHVADDERLADAFHDRGSHRDLLVCDAWHTPTPGSRRACSGPIH